ncbi:DUF317 domain-containing protein [Streptomyces sp. H39-C1]|uniref:DUF317 domain-containing protein n=1 Tax=Streptomyces sp. H39-C1 TaxID=3004355 RepID=UPI0022AF7E49|nr:DUF317 domain-containing protein [Streptomyces sp. H39-C1]MCZ4101795.1 DUF317 domain-containing protein [Streptomyces sp. H39-C1]
MSKFNDVIGPLIHLFNWRYEHDPRTGRIDLDSPCGSVFVDFEPNRQDGIWWEIRHHEPSWTARFSRQTPAEALAAVTQILPQLLGDTRHADRIPLTTSTLAQTAELNGWRIVRAGPITLLTSPDEHCHLRHEPDTEVPWRFEHSLYEGFDTEWSVTFTRDAPEYLVAQFFAHLASDVPVERVFNEVPFLVQHSDSALVTPVNGAAVNPHAHHAVAHAARAHADRQPRR